VSTSYKGRRDKGVRGEREVAEMLEAAGFGVRGLEGLGDHLALKEVRGHPLVLHVEVKRQETLQPDKWSRQAEAETPTGAVPVVAYRRNHEPWRVTLRLDEFLRLVG